MKTKEQKTVNVVQEPEAPIERNVLAKAIIGISESMQKLQRSGLNEKAVATLVAKTSGQPMYVVQEVMQAIGQLQRDYCR